MQLTSQPVNLSKLLPDWPPERIAQLQDLLGFVRTRSTVEVLRVVSALSAYSGQTPPE